MNYRNLLRGELQDMKIKTVKKSVGLICLILAAVMMICSMPIAAAEENSETEAEKVEAGMVKVVCAKEDVPQGTRLNESHLEIKEAYSVNLPANVISDPAEIINRYAAMDFNKGEYVYLGQTSKDMVVKANHEVLKKPIAKSKSDFVIVTDYIFANTGLAVDYYLQELIDKNPNRTIYFPAGEYILGAPIGTPADAQYSVSLLLDDGAVLKAADKWTSKEGMGALVCLGATIPKNDISSVGSYYRISGGILDGNGKADGISIDSGRETVIRNLCIKNAKTGILVKNGANNKSSDCDFEDITIIGNGKNSIGINVIGFDNTFSNIRMYDVYTGITGTGAGNFFKSIQIVNRNPDKMYVGTQGFAANTNNWYSQCYVENYEKAYQLVSSSLVWDCNAVWNNDACAKQTAFAGNVTTPIMSCKAYFHNVEGAKLSFAPEMRHETEVIFGCVFDESVLTDDTVYENVLATPSVCP